MKLSDITTAQNPVSGQKYNVLDPKAWISLILGAVVLALAWTLGNKYAGKVEDKIDPQRESNSPWDNVFNKT